MAPDSSVEDQLDYLLNCLQHAELPRPDFAAVAAANGIANANNAQKRFKAIVEGSGKYKLVKNQIVGASDAGVAPSTPAKAPVKRGRPAGRKAATKVEKSVTEKETQDDGADPEDDDGEEAKPSKKRKLGQSVMKSEDVGSE